MKLLKEYFNEWFEKWNIDSKRFVYMSPPETPTPEGSTTDTAPKAAEVTTVPEAGSDDAPTDRSATQRADAETATNTSGDKLNNVVKGGIDSAKEGIKDVKKGAPKVYQDKMDEILDKLSDSELGKKMDLKKLMPMLMMVRTVFKMITRAKSMFDIDTFSELADDLKDPKTIGEKIKKSQDAYKAAAEKFDKTTSINDLLTAYFDPRGEKANALFGADKKAPSGRYRLECQPAIQTHLEKKLGIKITSIEKDKAGKPIITATKDEKVFKIYSYTEDGKAKTGIKELVTDADGKITEQIKKGGEPTNPTTADDFNKLINSSLGLSTLADSNKVESFDFKDSGDLGIGIEDIVG